VSGFAIPDSVQPNLAPGVRLQEDKLRGHWVLQGPERMLVLDEVALAVLRRCDGSANLAEIVAGLAEDYDAAPEEIMEDVQDLLQDLQERRLVRL